MGIFLFLSSSPKFFFFFLRRRRREKKKKKIWISQKPNTHLKKRGKKKNSFLRQRFFFNYFVFFLFLLSLPLARFCVLWKKRCIRMTVWFPKGRWICNRTATGNLIFYFVFFIVVSDRTTLWHRLQLQWKQTEIVKHANVVLLYNQLFTFILFYFCCCCIYNSLKKCYLTFETCNDEIVSYF